MINKRMPANTKMENLTFLNDKKVNGELYAYLQSISIANEKKETIIIKKNMPIQADICQAIGIKTRNTLRTHLKYLIEQGYVIDEPDKYILPNKEEIFFMIPLETLQFLNDTLKEQVIKIYIYLGQRWKYKPNYVFTLEEISQHIGFKINNHSRYYTMLNNALTCLQNNGLIDYIEFYENNKPRKRLTGFSLTPIKRK